MANEREAPAPPKRTGDNQRDLERHALWNVRWLYEKLHYRDAFDQRKDKAILVSIAVVVLGAVAAMTWHAIVAAPRPEALDRSRCEQDFRVARIWELKKELAAKHPEMSQDEIRRQVELHYQDMKSLARIACTGGSKNGS